nr:MAG TPA: hypothetical protein [Caudoviricetes sp.]
MFDIQLLTRFEINCLYLQEIKYNQRSVYKLSM